LYSYSIALALPSAIGGQIVPAPGITSILLICGVYAKSFYQRKKKEHNYEKIFHHDIDNLNVRISRLYHNNRRRQYNPGQRKHIAGKYKPKRPKHGK
jgi:hypothetical protein